MAKTVNRRKVNRDYDEDFKIYSELASKGVPVPVSSTWLCAFLGLSPSCLAQWRRKGIGPKWGRIGKTIRYEFADILDYFQNGEQRPPKEFPNIF